MQDFGSVVQGLGLTVEGSLVKPNQVEEVAHQAGSS